MKISARTATIALILAACAAGVALAQDASQPAGQGPAPANSPAPGDSSANPSPPAQDAQAPAASSQPPSDGPVVQHVTNGPVPDTPDNRARYGAPMSNGGQTTAPSGN